MGAYLKLHFLRNVKPLGAAPDYSGRPNLQQGYALCARAGLHVVAGPGIFYHT